MARYKIEGIEGLEKAVRKIGQLPQKCVTKAAKKGANIPLKSARAKAPYLIGYLKKGIVLKGEKTKIKGKKVYQVTFDKSMNDVFVKETKSGIRYYYPASQEHGFRTRNGGYIPGFHYMRDGLVDNKSKVEKEIVDVFVKELDKVKWGD